MNYHRKIDLVIPYVDNTDVNWQLTYRAYKDRKTIDQNTNSVVRYRDWGSLKYLFRAIETYMSWVNKVFLIVQQESQVPKWLDRTNPKLRVVYHSDYIPSKYLPTFNANTIECFLWRILDLSEYFIYSNDDVFPNKFLKPEDFFDSSRVKINLTYKQFNPKNFYAYIWGNSYKFGFEEYGLDEYDSDFYLKTDHGMSPIRKSTMKHLFDYFGDRLYNTFTPTREACNVTQLIFHCYEKSINNVLESPIKNIHLKCKNFYVPKKIKTDILDKIKEYDTWCINDDIIDNFDFFKEQYLEALSVLYPNRCSFELEI